MTSPYASTTGPQLNPYSPMDMKTLVYSPEVQIFILHNGVQYDVSADVIRGWVDRRENAAATLSFVLANKPLVPGGQPRYNAGQPYAFSRMDVVTVYLKRTRMIQVFTGFLDQIPYRQLHPGPAEFRATCTLKKLLHTWWNPGTPANMSWFGQRTFAAMQAGDGQSADSNLGGLLRELLTRVGGWNPAQVHIQNFPMGFMPFVMEFLNRNMPGYRAAENALRTMFLGSGAGGPVRSSVGYNASAPLGAWPPAGAGIAGTGAAVYLPAIVAACDLRGMGPQTANLQQSSAIQQAGESGVGANDYDAPGWQQVANLGMAQTAQESMSDAAILAVACIMVETQWRNYTNPVVPESSTFPNDGPPPFPDHDSVGLFQQRPGWGTCGQRMNPFAAAGMFYDKMATFGWRNMDPGAAIFKVQVGASPEKYSAQVPAATALVQAYRKALGQGTEALTSMLTNTIPAASAVSATVTSAINSSISTYTSATATSTGGGSPLAGLRPGKPVPDSEGAINATATMMTTPYEYGGDTPGVGLDCSAFTSWAYRAIGVEIGRNTTAQLNGGQRIVPSTLAQRGDLLFPSGMDHVGIYLGAGMWVHTGGPPGTPPSTVPIPQPLSSMKAVVRPCPNGGIDPLAPFTPPVVGLPLGMPAGTGQRYASGAGGSAAGSSNESVAGNLFSFIFEPGTWSGDLAGLLPGEKQFIDGQPLIQMVQAVCKSGLRNFQSAPNGDFMAYTPDEFGQYGKPAVLALEDIEIRDMRIDLSDEPLTTHVYVDGDYSAMGQDPGVMGWVNTAGVATMENEPLFSQLRKVAPGDMQGMSGKDIMRKFGVRPMKQTYTMVSNPAMEFLLAMQLFMGKFSSMYVANVSFTFMPELYPGMRVLLRQHGLQMYCSAVTHTFDYENGFSTRAVLSSPTDPAAWQNTVLGPNPLANWQWPSDNFWTFNNLPNPSTEVVP